ncbi:MAG: CoA ester lyase [Clostridiales Family XIII bacterium]|jgi:citrate lyase subunit beta/citryl-CoA lyase|nr:CoA ester lyase [Clostridiales Family XIII bacterium]
MAIMRSSFYVPANNAKFIDKAPSFPADIITFDIEDAVPPQQKEVARKMTAEKLAYAASGGSEVYVRVNGWHTEFTNDDLEAVVYPGLHGVTLPKTRDADDVKRLDWKLEELETRRGIPVGSVKMSILLETASGIMNAYACCTASKRLVSVFFGAVDYCADMRIRLTNEAKEQAYARTTVAVAARSADLVALDAPFPDYSNMDAFEKNTLDGVSMGFEGRMIIHPSQIEVAHRLYSPAPEEAAHAAKVVKFFEEEGLAKGLASVALDGKMIDTPVYVNAQGVLARQAEIQQKEARRK